MERNFPILETKRLILREITTEDTNDVFKYLSDKDVVKFMGISHCQNIKDVEEEIGWYKSIYVEASGIRWGITMRDTGTVIGSCGFLNMLTKHYRAEVGYELSKIYWGQGIASEALEAVVKYGFQNLQLERIQALIEPANVSSQKLVERQGFIKEGLLRHYEYTCGKFDDLFMYSILKNDMS